MTDNGGRLISGENIAVGSGPVGVYLIHGFTGSTYEYQGLAHFLADAGYKVSARLLPGHGTTVEECNMTTAHDWISETEFHFAEFLLDNEVTFVVGLSMGAGIALHIASLYPVAGVVAMSSVLGVNPVRQPWLLPLLSPFKVAITKAKLYDGKNPAGHQFFGYDKYPVKGMREMIRLNKMVRKELPKVTAPALIMHSRADITADVENGQYLFDAVNSSDKRLSIYEKSGHVMPADNEKEAVWSEIAQFLNEHKSDSSELD